MMEITDACKSWALEILPSDAWQKAYEVADVL